MLARVIKSVPVHEVELWPGSYFRLTVMSQLAIGFPARSYLCDHPWVVSVSLQTVARVSSIMQGHLRPHCVVLPALNTPEFNTEIVFMSLACESS